MGLAVCGWGVSCGLEVQSPFLSVDSQRQTFGVLLHSLEVVT